MSAMIRYAGLAGNPVNKVLDLIAIGDFTISLKDYDRQRQSVDLIQVREEYRQQLLERPVVGAHEVESHFNSCSPLSSHGSADPWSSSCVVDESSEFRGL